MKTAERTTTDKDEARRNPPSALALATNNNTPELKPTSKSFFRKFPTSPASPNGNRLHRGVFPFLRRSSKKNMKKDKTVETSNGIGFPGQSLDGSETLAADNAYTMQQKLSDHCHIKSDSTPSPSRNNTPENASDVSFRSLKVCTYLCLP